MTSDKMAHTLQWSVDISVIQRVWNNAYNPTWDAVRDQMTNTLFLDIASAAVFNSIGIDSEEIVSNYVYRYIKILGAADD